MLVFGWLSVVIVLSYVEQLGHYMIIFYAVLQLHEQQGIVGHYYYFFYK